MEKQSSVESRTEEEILALPDDATLTPEDLMAWLKMPRAWICSHSGSTGYRPRIPGYRLGAKWRYRKGAIADWLRQLEKEAA